MQGLLQAFYRGSRYDRKKYLSIRVNIRLFYAGQACAGWMIILTAAVQGCSCSRSRYMMRVESVMEKIPQNKKKRVVYVTPQGIAFYTGKNTGTGGTGMSCFCYAGVRRALLRPCLRKWSQIAVPSVIMY